MIDTNAIRAKAADVAVTGQLTADYISESSADKDLSNIGIIPGSIEDEEIPYELKEGWKWVRMVDLGADAKNSFADGPFGSNLKREHYTTDKQVRIIQLSNVGELGWKDDNEKYTTYEHLETIKRSEVKAGNIVIAKMMPAGRAIIVPDVSKAYVLSSDCVKFVPNAGLNVRYLCYAINSQMFKKQVLQEVHGIGRERTSLSKLKSYLLPIPPVDEQAVIVDKIDNIYELLERIDDLQAKYSNDLAVLKSKIIDAGIQGKLTEQLPEDGDAENLYAQILNQKSQLIKEGKIKKEKPLPNIAEDEIPFEIPKNWKWVRFGDLYSLTNGIASRGTPGGKPHPVLRLADLTEGEVSTENVRDIELSDSEFDGHKICNGDIVFIRVNGSRDKVANAFLYHGDDEISYCDHLFSGRKICEEVDSSFIMHVYRSEMVKKQVDPEIKTTAGQNTINQGGMAKVLIPLPPHAEQKRIVLKINEILEQIS